MARFGLQQADPECYGLLVDNSEQFTKDLIVQLIERSRVRNQDGQHGLSHGRPGDRVNLKTVTYVNDHKSFGFGGPMGMPGAYRFPQQMPMFEPRENLPVQLICKDNSARDFNHLVQQELNIQKDRIELKAQVAQESQKAKAEEASKAEGVPGGSSAVGGVDAGKAAARGGEGKPRRARASDERLRRREREDAQKRLRG